MSIFTAGLTGTAALTHGLTQVVQSPTKAGVAARQQVNNSPSTGQTNEFLNKGEKNVDVYLGGKKGADTYAGISNDFDRRVGEHGMRFDSIQKITNEPLTRGQARGVEQVLIERNPHFENKINSISPLQPYYEKAVEFGKQWLEKAGLK